jgi:hypothetical protein
LGVTLYKNYRTHSNQWNRIERPKMNINIHSQLVLTKSGPFTGDEEYYLNKWF